MKILAFNCGSSTLKFQYVELENGVTPTGQGRCLAKGIVENVGGKSSIRFTTQKGVSITETAVMTDHGQDDFARRDERHLYVIEIEVVQSIEGEFAVMARRPDIPSGLERDVEAHAE